MVVRRRAVTTWPARMRARETLLSRWLSAPTHGLVSAVSAPPLDARGSLRVAVIGAANAAPLEEVVRVLPRSGFAVVVQCHADAAALEVLKPISSLPISEARGRVRLERDQVLVIPHECDGMFQHGELLVVPSATPRAPIDKLLRSLADEHAGHGTGVILDGHGTDGVLGIKRVKEAGGLTIAQTPEGEDTEMSRSAIATGMIDLVLPLSAIAERLAAFGPPAIDDSLTLAPAEPSAGDGHADALHDILALVRLRSGHDFNSYKRATLYRRVSRRMQVCQCTSIAGYHSFLRDHPGELAHLLRDFLISVTNFFRDRETFDALALSVIPRLFAARGAGDQVRVWVAGCATGEEAYSIGMLLCEHAATLPAPPQLQIFATDLDEDALAQARTGRYPGTIAVDVSPERLRRFFVPDGDSVRVTKELRDIVLFSPHSLLRDPPFSRLDLVSCRNLLIYLNRDAQDRVLHLFHFGLRPEGYLLLGSSESAENTTMFSMLDGKHRLFVRRPAAVRLAPDALVPAGRSGRSIPAPRAAPPAERVTAGELHHQLVERYAPPSVLVDDNLDVVHLSEHAGSFLQVAGGEPSRQLLRLIHPALRLDLRTAIHAARPATGRASTRVVRFEDAGRPRAVELRVRAVGASEPAGAAFLILFDELDPSPAGPAEPAATTPFEPMVRELEDELRRTRDQLRNTVEQYETSGEELKASNEELQAINEELRSATEELETSKEELQSVNEELTTLNHELNFKVDEISHANSDLQNLMTSTDIGVVFLDRELDIKRFTPRAQDLFNVIPSDLGRPLAHLTHRLRTDDLPELARSVLQTLRVVEREVQTRDGRRYLARLLPYRSLEDRIDGVVLTFVEVSDLRNAVAARDRSEAALLAIEQRLRYALRTAPMMVVRLDAELRTTWGYLLGEELELADGADEAAPGLVERFAPEHAARFAAIAQDVLRDGGGQRAELDVVLRGERRTYDVRIERDELGVIAVGFDITPSKRAEAALRDADQRKDEFLATLSHELRNPLTPLKVALDLARLPDADPAQRERAHGVMARQVVQLTQLVDDLLDLSRITQGKIELVREVLDPVRVVEATLEAIQPLLRQHGHALTVTLPDLACRVLGDHGRLTQVLTNLMNNAVKYTPPGGHLALRLAPDPARGVLAIQVSDDGQGIAPELLPRIFEIFVQGRDAEGRAHGGLGIGLNLVRRLVELHGGRVSAASAGPGRGSELTVELPLVAAGSEVAR
jgi:two-component system, chemotaxis family, CheB/CheR fusion protein